MANQRIEQACLFDLRHKVMFYHTMSISFCLLEGTKHEGCEAWALTLYSMYLIRGFNNVTCVWFDRIDVDVYTE